MQSFTMECFHQRRAEFIAQEIKFFDAEVLYLLLEMVRGNGDKLEQITDMIGLEVDYHEKDKKI